jgi:hypothetical protein
VVAIASAGPDRAYLVCGDCAKVFLDAGAVRSTVVTEIGLGHECDTHPKEPRPQATSVFEGTPHNVAALFVGLSGAIPAAIPAPKRFGEDPDLAVLTDVSEHDRPTASDLLAATRAMAAEPGPVLRPDNLPTVVGPQTAIAAQLLAAWSQGTPQNCDRFAVEQAASMARLLLLETKGA